ncbi:MAG: phosphate/phosphite/phosphonate ABC transporter substrate-binding protein [Moraxellaceae bacterium]|nr:phosphate/phosphite/phosphonate ABC transporter substrate-binding protein [Pseudobdellovibrionaceae bacterium]
MKKIKSLFLLLIFLFSCTKNEAPKGSAKNPIQVALVPAKDSFTLMLSGDQFRFWMEKETGYKFNVTVPNSYIAVVESFGTQRTDLAFMTTSSYFLAYKKYQAEVQFVSIGKSGKSTYRGQFIVKAHSKIKTLKDIENKKIAYVDAASASGYILPAHLLKTKGIKPSETIFAGKHDAVVTMVYSGQVDVGATFYTPSDQGKIQDARRLVLTQFPDVESQVKILDYTEELPNDALVFRKELPDEIKITLQKALKKWIKTSEGIKNLQALNNGVDLKTANVSDYQKAFEMLEQYKNTP